jgi:hypothetical protein
MESSSEGIQEQKSNGLMTYFEKVVDEDQKMQTLTPRAYRASKLCYQAYQSEGLDKTKRYHHYLSDKVKRQLVDNELRLETETSKMLTIANINILADRDLEKIVARALVPGSVQEYKKVMKGALTKFKPMSDTYSRLDPDGYFENMHAPVSKLIEEFADYDALFRLGLYGDLTEAHLPKLRYGRNDEDEGIFRIFLRQLGSKFFKSFELYLTSDDPDKLKKMKSLDEFLSLVRKANNEIANMSKSLDRMRGRMMSGKYQDEEDKDNKHAEKKKQYEDRKKFYENPMKHNLQRLLEGN